MTAFGQHQLLLWVASNVLITIDWGGSSTRLMLMMRRILFSCILCLDQVKESILTKVYAERIKVDSNVFNKFKFLNIDL